MADVLHATECEGGSEGCGCKPLRIERPVPSSLHVSEEAIEAAAKELYECERGPDHNDPEYDWEDMSGYDFEEGDSPERVRDKLRDDARTALAAAVPLLREQIAQEIEALTPWDFDCTGDYASGFEYGRDESAQLARGAAQPEENHQSGSEPERNTP